MYRVHDPTITIAIGSVWLQLSSERVSLGAWKIARQTPWFLMMVIYRYLGRKKLHVQLAYEGDQFKKGKNVSLLCCCHILVCHTKIKQMIHGSIEQWGNINGTDRQTDIQQTPCHSNQSRQIEIHVYQNMLFFPPKRVLECTSVQENCSYIKTFLNHAPSWLAVK